MGEHVNFLCIIIKINSMFFRKLRKKYRRKKTRKKIYVLLKNTFLLGVAFSFFVVGIILIWATSLKIPDFNALDDRKTTNATEIYDRTGKVLLYNVHEEVKQTVVPFYDISPYIKNATVAIEDSEFYDHIGIRPISFLRAVIANITTGDLTGQGGSTITQQVIKNALLTTEKKVSRKLKEWIIAIKLEQEYSKDEILALYINEAPYGGNIYGVEEASFAFFGKHAKDITLPEAAYLAALPQRPSVLSPYGNHTNLLEERKNLVLSRMNELNFISKDEYNEAIIADVEFLPRSSHGIKAPHFVTWVKEQLVEMYGERGLQENGYKVITTLDYNLQQKAEEVVTKYAEENELKFNAKNAGMVGIDPKTGDVLVMVGSRDYFDVENDGNFNTTLSQNRQPGSSFKPFVYATAFTQGYTPDTILFNLQTEFSTICTPEGFPLTSENSPKDCFMPKNYDNTYNGPMTLRDALAQSVNVPAVKLLYLTGITNSLLTAENMGITSLTNSNEYGLTLVLGSGGVSPLEMTSAYGVFANEGVRIQPQNILYIENNEGKTIRSFSGDPKRVIDKNVALQISDILSDNIARTPAFGARSYLYFEGRDVAVKTGTTNEYRDAWIIGYTPSFALGTWVGNNDNSSMEKKVAGFIVAPMWNDMMQQVLVEYPHEIFSKPEPTTTINDKPILRGIWEGGERYFIDKISRKKATEYTPEELVEEKVLTNIHNILYWIQKNNPRGPQPQKPEEDFQYLLWEYSVQKWIQQNGYSTSSQNNVPTEYDDIHTPEKSPTITIIKPDNNSNISNTSPYTIKVMYKKTFNITHVDYFVNDIFIGRSKKAPYDLTFTPKELKQIKTENILKAVIYDSVLNTNETISRFKI